MGGGLGEGVDRARRGVEGRKEWRGLGDGEEGVRARRGGGEG